MPRKMPIYCNCRNKAHRNVQPNRNFAGQTVMDEAVWPVFYPCVMWDLEHICLSRALNILQVRRSLLDLDARIAQILGLDVLIGQG